ncbi:MAG: phosphoribosyltransferase family protein, partial [Vulcanimicrobiaceae bacterium]
MSALDVARERTLMSAQQIDRMIARLAHQILEPDDAQDGVVLIGIRRGGEMLARRLAAKMEEIAGVRPGLGFLNINLYRDDDIARPIPESDIHDDLNGRVVIVVDDVL